jgi:hypothetical protein
MEPLHGTWRNGKQVHALFGQGGARNNPRQTESKGDFEMRRFLFGTISAVSAAAALSATSALAVQDMPTTIDGIQMVCTGVGSSKDDPRWKEYPVKIVLATTGGADLANAHVTLTKAGHTLVETDCNGPWVLFKAPPGQYTATATLIGGSGQSHSARFSASGAGQKEVNILFDVPSGRRPADAR